MAKKKDIPTEEDPVNQYNPLAIGRDCFMCAKTFTVEEIDESSKLSKAGIKNIPVMHPPLPGFIHRRCRAHLAGELIENPVSGEALREIKEIKDGH